MSIRLEGDWQIAQMTLERLGVVVKKAADLATRYTLGAAAEFVEDAYTGKGKASAFVNAQLPAEGTIAKRRFDAKRASQSTRPLFETGGLAGSLRFNKRIGGWALEIGGGSSRTGKPYSEVAEIAEFGREFVIDMSPEMRAFLILMYRKLGESRVDTGRGFKRGQRGKILISIPGRPVWKQLGIAMGESLVATGGGKFPDLSWTVNFLKNIHALLPIIKAG